MSKNQGILFSDGSIGTEGDFPIAVVSVQEVTNPDGETGFQNKVVDPIFNSQVTDNLYGRMMTLVEATTDANKLKAVKDLFSKELGSWARDVYESAREISENCNSSNNIYTKR